MKSIIYIIGSGNIGGREKFLFELLKEQSRYTNIKTAVIFLSGTGFFFDKIKNLDTKVYDLSGVKIKWTAIRKITNGFDIIVPTVFNLSVYFGLNFNKNKIIFNIHGERYKQPDVTGRKKTAKKRRIFYSIKRFGRRWITNFFAQKFFRKINKHIVASNYLKDYLNSHFNINRQKIAVVPNFITPSEIKITIDKDIILKKYLGIKNPFIIGFAGRFDQRKRIDRLIEGFNNFVKNKIAKNAYLFLVGDGEPLKSELKKKAEELNVIDKIIFTGYKTDVYNYINLFDIFVLPSDNENFGLSLVEAMYLKKASIIFADSKGPAEFIINEDNGYIVKDVNELSEKFSILYENSTQRLSIGESAHISSMNFENTKVVCEYTNQLIN